MQTIQFVEPAIPAGMPVPLQHAPQQSAQAQGSGPSSLTGSVGLPKTPTGRRPSLDLEYELFRDTGGQVPELSQPTKLAGGPTPMSLTDSFPASHEFLLDMHGGAVTPPMRSPTGLSVPIPFQGVRRPSVELPFAPPMLGPSSFAFPPQPHGAPLSGSAAPDSGVTSPPTATQSQQQQQAQAQSQTAFRPQTRLVSRAAVSPAMRAPPNAPAKPAAPQYSSLPSSPEEPTSPRRRGMPAEEKARVRAEQSRTSSRLYRLRKKAYQQSLESTIDGIKSENSQLRKELDQAKETISKLQNEIANLKESKA